MGFNSLNKIWRQSLREPANIRLQPLLLQKRVLSFHNQIRNVATNPEIYITLTFVGIRLQFNKQKSQIE